MIPITPMASDIAGGWSAFYSMVGGASGIIPGLWRALALIGIAIFVWALVSYLWKKFRQRGGQGGGARLGWAIAFATLLVSPTFIIPLLARVADALINGPGQKVVTTFQGWL